MSGPGPGAANVNFKLRMYRHETLLLLAMAYGVRRNEANRDCPGFKGNGGLRVCRTRQLPLEQ
jgi:hypothetical protein